MLNRGEDSGCRDHPQNEVTRDAVLSFVTFFDWDSLDLVDWRYVRIIVREWPSHPELVGKHALRPRHLQPCSATCRIALSTCKLDTLALPRCLGKQSSICAN
jgi:hypothetical protein